MQSRKYPHRTHMFLITLVVSLALGFGGHTSLVHAEDAPQFGIRPNTAGGNPTTDGYFVLKAQPGDTLTNSIVVANSGTVPVRVSLYPVDAGTAQSGGAVYMDRADPRKDVSAWVTLENTTVDVAPQKQTTVNFTVIVPATARSGQHLGGIAAQLENTEAFSTATTQTASFGVTTITRALTAVQVNVGPDSDMKAASLHITGAQVVNVDGLPTLTLAITNDGATLAKSHGEVTMKDTTGKPVLTNQFALDTFLPGTSIQYPVQVAPPTVLGTYAVHVTLDFGGSNPALFDGAVVVTPQAIAEATVAPRSRLGQTPAAGASGTAVATTGTATNGGSSGNNTMLLLILGGAVCVLGLGGVGLTVALMRARARQGR